jgi:hypothetical protein
VTVLEEPGLYAAPAYPGAFRPVPVVAVAGVDVASGAGLAVSPALMVVDDVAVTWGQEDVLAQPEPATGTLTLFDPTGTWATTADRRGLEVTVRYQGLTPVTGTLLSVVYFRGRIGSPLKVSPRTVRHPVTGDRIRGTLIEVPLQSREVDLGNIIPRSGWPAETLGARVDRCVTVAQQNGLLMGGANLRDYWTTAPTPAVAAKDQVSLLEHLSGLFDSAGGDTWTYRPDSDDIVFIPRRNYETYLSTARLHRETTGVRANKGAFVRARDFTFGTPDTDSATGQHLDGGTLEYDPDDGVTSPSRVTRVAISHPDQADPTTTRTVERLVRREPWDRAGGSAALEDQKLGVRTAQVSSRVSDNSLADLALSDAELVVRREGSRWLLEPLRLSTRRTGGFESSAQGSLLLAGHQKNDVVFLQRSWLPSLGLRPAIGVMGGVIRYAAGGWDLEIRPAPITTVDPQHSLTWEDLNTTDPALRLKAWDGPHPEGMDKTVTWEDLRFVGRGLDNITLPASPRDEYQA